MTEAATRMYVEQRITGYIQKYVEALDADGSGLMVRCDGLIMNAPKLYEEVCWMARDLRDVSIAIDRVELHHVVASFGSKTRRTVIVTGFDQRHTPRLLATVPLRSED